MRNPSWKPLFDSPAEHAANPPENWTVVRDPKNPKWWGVFLTEDLTVEPLDRFGRKRDAVDAATAGGMLHTAWLTDGRWYAGEAVHNRKLWAEIVEAREQERAKAERQIKKAGLAIADVNRWRDAVDAKTPELDELLEAAREMFATLTSGELIDPDFLNESEADELRRDLADTHGFATDAEQELHRVKYLGLGADRTAAQVLEDLIDVERERTATAWRKGN
ncbi:hypothetical protein ACFVAJ_17510 [Agromyces sp. NPDC057679]|uniref:hypothetical protein n=1 Tax=Agromyces sp. NPDC057679 TaxID=3346207 RepID=UPI00366BA74A